MKRKLEQLKNTLFFFKFYYEKVGHKLLYY